MPLSNHHREFLLTTILATLPLFCFTAQSAKSDVAPAPTLAPTSQPVDLALNKPATASATESDEHAAAKANDGDDDTRWCADSADAPQWWQVDMGTPTTVTSCKIKFEMDEKKYQYVIEGSADGAAWKTLSDQSATTKTDQVQSLTFEKPADGIRYVRIRFTGLDDGCWASMFDFRVYGK